MAFFNAHNVCSLTLAWPDLMASRYANFLLISFPLMETSRGGGGTTPPVC